VGRGRFWTFAICLLAFALVVFLTGLPFDYYSRFVLEHQYGHSNQTLSEWFGELLIGEAIALLLGLCLFWFLYTLIRRSPRRWWLWAGVSAAPLSVLLIVVAPIWIAPWFNDFTELRNPTLKSDILALAAEAGIENSRVLQVDASKQSKKYNAYVTGLFATKRIVLYDTMLEDMTSDEILFVMGHEMGHYVMHHVWLGVAAMTSFVFVAAFLTARISARLIARFRNRWGFSSLQDYASLPLLVLLVSLWGFLSQPVFAALSRHFERRADEFGLALSQNRRAAAKALEKLAARNLNNPDPSAFVEFWLYDHPTIKDRVTYVLGTEP
jgi:Zn-dependent protease with chaperone function